MSATTIVHALLSAAPAVTALVSDRVYPTMLPEGVPPPALVHQEISTVDLPPIGAAAAYTLRRSRVQISALAATFTAAASLLDAAMTALMFKAGTIGSESVVVIMRDTSGPNGFDPDLNLFHHVADVMVTWRDF